MQLKPLSLRLSIALTILTMSFISFSLAIFTGETYQDIALNNQKNAISKIIRNDIYVELEKLSNNLSKLGLNLQSEQYFKYIFKRRQKDKLTSKLNSHFNQYFVTTGIIDLQKIYAYDSDFNIIASSTENTTNNLIKPACQKLINKAKQRTGFEKLKTIHSLCQANKQYYYSTLIPIGGLSVMGYLQIIANPVHSLKGIDKRLDSPIKISSKHEKNIYRTKDWPTQNNLANTLLASYDLYSEDKQYIFTITTARNITELNAELDKTRSFLTFIALFITLATMLFGFIILSKSTTRPVRKLLQQLKKIHKDKDNLGQQIAITGASELQELEIEFNRMTTQLKDLYQEIYENNQLLKSEVQERKKAEKELQFAHEILEERIEERTADLKKVSEQAQKANMAKSEFLSRMSHELRTPLNAILGYTELLLSDEDDKLSDNHRYEVDVTKHAGMHLLSLINEVLDLSAIEAGEISIAKNEVHLNNVIAETFSLISPIADKNKITVSNNTRNINNIYIETEHQRLKQILLNLLSNAVKYNKENGRVTFNVEIISKNSLKIEVTDTGIGIPQDKLDNVFAPFNRLDEYKARVDGTGIGLSITKSLVEIMGGEIGINSIEKEGSTFWITLPYVVKETSDLQSNNEIATSSKTNQKKFTKNKILVVEDDEINQELMKAILKSFSIDCDIAENGLVAIEKIKKDEYAFAFMDLNMPQMDGITATQEIRKLNSEKSKIIIIALTANVMPGDKERCLEAGMDDYLQKPISLSTIKETLDKWMA